MHSEKQPSDVGIRPGVSWEMVGIFFLVVVDIWLLAISWRKWPDPVIDFGRELYIPWRLANGAVLYRDVDSNYGPLSQYFHALIFYLFGPGLMHLVWVNLAVQSTSAALIYRGVRMGWGRLAAFAGTLIFVAVFSFSQFMGVGGYNFAAPYSHESIHGFLLILLLIHLGFSWIQAQRIWKTALIGMSCGLAVLLKVEIIFAAGLVTLGTIIRAACTGWKLDRRSCVLHGVLFLVCGMAPAALATLALARAGHWSLAEAFVWANMAWTSVHVYRNMVGSSFQMAVSGLDHVGANLGSLAWQGGLSLAVLFLLGAILREIDRRPALRWMVILLPVITILGSFSIPWLESGRVFPIWIVFSLVWCVRDTLGKEAATSAIDMRWLYLLAASALLSRMCLNPRIYHYGYYQAALAGVVITATLLRAILDWQVLSLIGRRWCLGAIGGLLAVGLWQLTSFSASIYGTKTAAIGEGADRFYDFATRGDDPSSIIEDVRQELVRRPEIRSLLVVPEGVTLNYLSRRPTTTPAYNFVPAWLFWREGISQELKENPPDAVVLMSRDMREFGVQFFGDTTEHGKVILDWVRENYRPVWAKGGHPLQRIKRGAVLFVRKQN